MEQIPGLTAARPTQPHRDTRCRGVEAPVDGSVAEAKLKALQKLAETHLLSTPGFRHGARIGPAAVELVTDSLHLLEWWRMNWFSCESGLADAGRICAVSDVEKREPGVFYDADTLRAVAFNTTWYGHLWTVGMAMAARATRSAGGLLLRCATLGVASRGVVLVAGRSWERVVRFALAAGADPRISIGGLNRSAVIVEKDSPVARCVENAFYLPGRLARVLPELAPFADCADTENLVQRFEDCTNGECLAEVARGRFQCVFHAGYRGCVWSDPHCGLMLMPAWLNRSCERSLRAPVLGLAVLSEWAPAAQSEAPAVETVPAKLAWDVIERQCGQKTPDRLDWLVPEGASDAEIRAFIERLAAAVPLAIVHRSGEARPANLDEFVGCFVRSEES